MIVVMKKTIVRFTLALGLLLLSQGARAQTFTYWTEENGLDFSHSITVAEIDYLEINLEASLVSSNRCMCDENAEIDVLRDGAGEYIYYFEHHSTEEGSEAYVRIVMTVIGDEGLPVIDYMEVVNPWEYECCQILGGKYIDERTVYPADYQSLYPNNRGVSNELEPNTDYLHAALVKF